MRRSMRVRERSGGWRGSSHTLSFKTRYPLALTGGRAAYRFSQSLLPRPQHHAEQARVAGGAEDEAAVVGLHIFRAARARTKVVERTRCNVRLPGHFCCAGGYCYIL